MIDTRNKPCPVTKRYRCSEGISVIRFSDLPCDQCRVDFFAENLAHAIEQYDKVRKNRHHSGTCSYWGKAVVFYGWALELAKKEIAGNAQT